MTPDEEYREGQQQDAEEQAADEAMLRLAEAAGHELTFMEVTQARICCCTDAICPEPVDVWPSERWQDDVAQVHRILPYYPPGAHLLTRRQFVAVTPPTVEVTP